MLSRRNFFLGLLTAGASFTVLPPATTYERIWRSIANPEWIINPEWVNAPLEMRGGIFVPRYYYGVWHFRSTDYLVEMEKLTAQRKEP